VKFVDETVITVQSGDGGDGCVSFRREKYVPRGGPDGGDGGDGGNVIFKTTPRKRTLYDFHFKRHFKAEKGRHGQGKQKTGRKGKDLIIEIPPGTLILEAESGRPLADLIRPGDVFVAAKGGKGGLGNTHYKSSTNRAPRAFKPGESGHAIQLKLELKLLADVGLIGLPNAGKSTLIGAISSARPKTAAYPFTTLSPNLGVVPTDWSEPFVVADIPGLIEGAHHGAGLGIRFLRHVERTRILVHLIDVSAIDPQSPLQAYHTVNTELTRYRAGLADKPQIIVLNKMDLEGSEEMAEPFAAALQPEAVLKISAVKGTGLKQLLSRITSLLDELHEPAQEKVS
jgi:GTP-binding protein